MQWYCWLDLFCHENHNMEVNMYNLSTQSLKPGMILYEDIYNPSNELIFKANTHLTQENIQTLCEYNFDQVALAEPNEVDMPRYEHLHQHPHFQKFNAMYTLSLSTFNKLIRILDTSIDLNTSSF